MEGDFGPAKQSILMEGDSGPAEQQSDAAVVGKENDAASRTSSETDDSEFYEESEKDVLSRALDWRKQMTFRAMIVGIITGLLCTFVALNLGLTGAGVSPSYSLVAAIIGFTIMKPITAIAMRIWNGVAEFTKEENCVIQGVATSIQSYTHALGLSTWLFAMHENVAIQTEGITFANGSTFVTNNYTKFMDFKAANPEYFPMPNTITLDLSTMIGLAICISFTGVITVTYFRKLYIVDLELPFPSPTATAVLIKGFFTEDGRALAQAQLKLFKIAASAAFVMTVLDWMFSGSDVGCVGGSYSNIPIFGLAGVAAGWYLNMGSGLQFLGIGMILTPNISFSIVFGGILSYGILFPWLWNEKGLDTVALGIADNETAIEAILSNSSDTYWFDQNDPGMSGMYGYKIMLGLAIMLGDSLFALCLMFSILISQYRKGGKSDVEARKNSGSLDATKAEREFYLNTLVFTSSGISNRILILMFLALTVMGTIAIPFILPVPWYFCLTAFILMPLFSLVTNYIAGLTDWNLSSNLAKLSVLVFGAWAGSVDPENAITIGLLACGVVYCGASNSCDVIGDLKTGFLLRTSPKAMIIAQFIGFVIGAITTPMVFNLFLSTTPDMGFPDSNYRNSFGNFYRLMAVLAADGGFESLPTKCMFMVYIAFPVGFLMPLTKYYLLNFLEKREMKTAHGIISFWWPSPAAAAIPFMARVDWVVPVGIGMVVVLIWDRVNHQQKENFHQLMAAGIIIGNGLWSVLSIILALSDVDAPLCLDMYPINDYYAPY